jgi:hypothetical protein
MTYASGLRQRQQHGIPGAVQVTHGHDRCPLGARLRTPACEGAVSGAGRPLTPSRKDQECLHPPTLPEIQLEHAHGYLSGAVDVGDHLVIAFAVGCLGSGSPVLAAVGRNHRLEHVVVQRVNHPIEGGHVFVSRGENQAVGLVP